MNSGSISPPLTKVAAALRKTTEILAKELVAPTKNSPLWTDFEWRIGRAVAAMQGISSLLCDTLRWRGPESWREFLQEQQDHAVGRHSQISHLLDAIDSHARRDGVALVALKGAALHAIRIYTPGERPMGDIDLLVRDDDANAIAQILDACGYEAAFTSDRHQVFKPRVIKTVAEGRLGEHVDNPIKIEVHTRIAEALPARAVDITQFLFSPGAHPGRNAYPSVVSLMLHLLLHAAGNMRAHALRLIQLHDIALLTARFDAIDWDALLATHVEGHGLWWAFAPLVLTERYYPGTIPPTVLARLAVDCPWLLRRFARRQHLTDVSWSNIRIAAFPGVEWSRTPTEAVAFMRGRIWPSRKVRLELKIGTAEIPGVSTVPWYGIPHGSRIMRWVFSRPPRVQTLLSVRAALGQDN
jgi:Uncharacterised nucleotidyltransferase